MSFLDKLRPRSMKRRKAKTSTTAGDIFRGTVEVPMSEPEPTVAQQMAERAAKQEENLKTEHLDRALREIKWSAGRGEYRTSLRYNDVYLAKSELKSLGFRVSSSGHLLVVKWGKK